MHDAQPVGPVALRHKLLLSRLCVHKDDIHIPVHTVSDGRAGPLCKDLDFDARIFLEFREQNIQQP